MKILIIMEGGLVHHVLADAPVEVLTIDYDVEGADVGDTVSVPQGEGEYAEAYIVGPAVDVNPARTAKLFTLAAA